MKQGYHCPSSLCRGSSVGPRSSYWLPHIYFEGAVPHPSVWLSSYLQQNSFYSRNIPHLQKLSWSKNHTMCQSGENLKLLPVNLVQTGSVQHSHFSTYFCLPYQVHVSDPHWCPNVPTAENSMVLTSFLHFLGFFWLILLNNSDWYDTKWTSKNIEGSGHGLIGSIILAIA